MLRHHQVPAGDKPASLAAAVEIERLARRVPPQRVQEALVHGCRFLNFSRSKSELDLAARRAVKELEGDASQHLDEYADGSTERHAAMVDRIRQRLGLTTLCYQRLPDMIAAIGLPRERLCTYCWNGESLYEGA